MPLSAASSVENTFVKGLITEASGLNFPENACTDTDNCIFNYDGTVQRRAAIDLEFGAANKNINRTAGVVATYVWRNVAGDGDTNILVAQIGATLYFWRLLTSGSLSSGAVATTVSLNTYLAAGAANPETVEAQFASGNGYLFVTHPLCNAIYISYNTATDVATATAIDIQIRDLEGDVADPQSQIDTSRLTSTLAALDVHHYYNLLNQGWTNSNLTTWDTNRADMPNNIDVMWTFKNSSETFDTTLVDKIVRGNTPAPRGHYIFSLFNQNRDTVSGLTGTTNGTTSFQRMSTCAFFAGRVFYAGLNYLKYNSKVFFSQIIERDGQFGFCYQKNDPTSESLFDLNPDDGGFISIPEAGTIIKLITITGGLLIFAQQGVWFVSGSTGLGFAANDYQVTKIASVQTLSNNSFVDLGGYPAWWTGDGIYVVGPPMGGSITPSVKPVTFTTIKSFYDSIPLSCKLQARGSFNFTSGVVQWVYRSTETNVLEQKYEFDRILNFNVFTGAFYTWSVSPSSTKLNSIFVFPADSGSLSIFNIIDGLSENVIDAAGDQVVSYASTALVQAPSFKYFVSTPDGAGSYNITFADTSSGQFRDWYSVDSIGVDYTSFFTTGYKIHGQDLRKFQPTWVNFTSKTGTVATQYYVQSLWDYAISGTTGRWSSRQIVTHTDLNYSYGIRRIKMRGHGKVLQFKVSSVTGQPFYISGWSTYETGNTLP